MPMSSEQLFLTDGLTHFRISIFLPLFGVKLFAARKVSLPVYPSGSNGFTDLKLNFTVFVEVSLCWGIT